MNANHPTRTALALAAAAAAWSLLLVALGVGEAVTYFLPALLILLPLIGGRFPGEGALRRARRGAGPPRPAPAGPGAPARRTTAYLPRGGLLIAGSLAGRAPPGRATCAVPVPLSRKESR